ncbi:MAG: hypothetical protein J5643_04085 [Lachnospiraceae bacterium]|nr:hypothetical protein [Lachnospiraceae bacterium]MBR5769920.1 hypothetical protein [Clostridia bacterium]
MKRYLCIFIIASFLVSLFVITPFTATALFKVKIACVGDSITDGGFIPGYGYPDGQGLDDPRCYPKQLEALLGENYEVKNFGDSGRTLMSTADYPYISAPGELYRESLEYDADIVLIMLGTNDAKVTNDPSTTNWKDGSPEQFKTDLKALIEVYRNLPNHPTVYVLTSPVAFNNGNYNIVPANVDAIAELQREVAAELNAPLIDMHTLTANMGAYFTDNIHPNQAGYARLAELVYNELINDFTVPSAPVNVKVASNGSGRAIVSWNTGNKGGLPTLSFNVYIDGELVSGFDRTTYTAKNLTNGSVYEFTVTAVNALGESEHSEVVLLEPTAADPKVTGVTDGATYDLADGAPKASWKTATSAELDGEPYEKGTEITAVGNHTLVVTNDNVVVSISFTVINSNEKPGDMDGDGEITVADALAVLRIAAKLVPETPDSLRIADMDGDGEITVSDALRVLRIAAKLA